jgi:hypothetical protein
MNTGTTFAGIQYESPVMLRYDARDNGFNATKTTRANVQLFGHVKDFNLYTKQVQRSAYGIPENKSIVDIRAFTPAMSFFTHTDVFSLVEHAYDAKPYLFCIVNSSKASYKINGYDAKVNEVAALCNPMGASKLYTTHDKVYNNENGIYHKVHVRTIALSSLDYINVNKLSLKIKK